MMLSLMVAAAAATITAPEVVKWQIDVNHSEVSFRVRHFVSRVPGTFKVWNGTILADPSDLTGGSVEVSIQTGSIDTRNERRDAHLRSPDFFAADSFPTITFKSTKVEARNNALTISGDLTIRGVTKPVVLTGEYVGTTGTPEPSKQRIGFTATTKINRMDFGVKWNRAVEGGGVMLGDDVDVTINIEAVRQ